MLELLGTKGRPYRGAPCSISVSMRSRMPALGIFNYSAQAAAVSCVAGIQAQIGDARDGVTQYVSAGHGTAGERLHVPFP